MSYTEEEFNHRMDQLAVAVESTGDKMPKMDRVKGYSKYLENEYEFIQKVCYSCYPTDQMFLGYTRGLKYKKYNENVQKTLLHHIIVDNSEAFDGKRASDYRYDTVYKNIKTLQDAIDVFTELGLAQTNEPNLSLYEELCLSFSKDFIDLIKSEITIKSYEEINREREIKHQKREADEELRMKILMDEKGITKPLNLWEIGDIAKNLANKLTERLNLIKETKIKHLEKLNEYLESGADEETIKNLKSEYKKNVKELVSDFDQWKDEAEKLQREQQNTHVHFGLILDSLNNIDISGLDTISFD